VDNFCNAKGGDVISGHVISIAHATYDSKFMFLSLAMAIWMWDRQCAHSLRAGLWVRRRRQQWGRTPTSAKIFERHHITALPMSMACRVRISHCVGRFPAIRTSSQ
jgi:hypothetical protein